MADMLPTPEDLARDAAADLERCNTFRQQVEFNLQTYHDQGNYSGTGFPEFMLESPLVTEYWIRRAIAAEARLNRLETLCGELGKRSVSDAHNAEDAETLHECLLGLAEILKSIGENARRPAT